jgi:hypothetical protein
MAVCDYEHIEPLFVDAERHDPAAITLLCGRCHGKVNRGLLSKETVKLANAAPKALEKGFSFEVFDIGPLHPNVRIGSLQAIRPRTVIRALGEDLLKVDEPEQPGGPFRLSAVFSDRDGKEIFRIKDNVWETPADNWDVDVTGPRITLRKGLGDLVLQLRVNPPNEVIIERLDMHFRGVHAVADEQQFGIQSPSGKIFQTHALTLSDCEALVEVLEDEMFVGVNCAPSVYVDHAIFGNLPPGTLQSGKGPLSGAGRNAPCPCGSGLKYKRCHGKS